MVLINLDRMWPWHWSLTRLSSHTRLYRHRFQNVGSKYLSPLTISDNSSQTFILFQTNATTLALKVSTNRSFSLTSSGTSDRIILKSTKRRLSCHFRSRFNLCLILNSSYLHQWLTVSMRLQSRKEQVPAVNSTKLSACCSRPTHGSWGWLHWLVYCT